jgi:cyclic pyranopterin phosphate synthase
MALASSLRQLPARSATPGARTVEYLRISVTDRCNERCLYCLPEQHGGWASRESVLSYEEILAVVRAAIGLGFRHFRITGGEPLLRREISVLIGWLVAEPGVASVGVTTNGTRLAPLAEELFAAGLRRLNVSLDALDPDRYRAITRGEIGPVLAGLEAARAAGFRDIKLNTVLIRGRNEEDIVPLVHFAAEHGMPIRFIELMPVSLTEMLDESNFLPVGEVRQRLETVDKLEPLPDKLGVGPAKYWRLPNLGVTVGFIGALTDLHFCDHCNKVRLTADGKIRPCLGNHGEFDLVPALRPDIQPTALRSILVQSLSEKPPEHLFRDNYQPNRIMTAIGG